MSAFSAVCRAGAHDVCPGGSLLATEDGEALQLTPCACWCHDDDEGEEP